MAQLISLKRPLRHRGLNVLLHAFQQRCAGHLRSFTTFGQRVVQFRGDGDGYLTARALLFGVTIPAKFDTTGRNLTRKSFGSNLK